MLNSVGRVLETDEDRDHEVLAAGGQCAERIFHVGTAGLVDYFEITWSIGLEEGLEKLACLVAAAVTGAGEAYLHRHAPGIWIWAQTPHTLCPGQKRYRTKMSELPKQAL